MTCNGLIFNSTFIPREVVTHILDFVDLNKDILICRVVCRNWNEIISGELWRKKLTQGSKCECFSKMSTQQKYSLNYPWFIFHELFLNDSFSKNLFQNFVTSNYNFKHEIIDLRECGVSYFLMEMRPKIIITVCLPSNTGTKLYQYRISIRLLNHCNQMLQTVTKTFNFESSDLKFSIELEDYQDDVRFIEVNQNKRTRFHEFVPVDANVDIRLSCPQFCEKEWSIMSNDALWLHMLRAQRLTSFSKTSPPNYPWFVAREISRRDPYGRNLVVQELKHYVAENSPMKYGFWHVTCKCLPSLSNIGGAFLVQTICLRDQGIFGFLMDKDRPTIRISILYPNTEYSTFFEWHLHHRIIASLLDSNKQVLHEQAIDKNRKFRHDDPPEIDWKFENYDAGVRYIRIHVGCKYYEPPFPVCLYMTLPPVKVTVDLPKKF